LNQRSTQQRTSGVPVVTAHDCGERELLEYSDRRRAGGRTLALPRGLIPET
jgi:hypothetical protein